MNREIKQMISRLRRFREDDYKRIHRLEGLAKEQGEEIRSLRRTVNWVVIPLLMDYVRGVEGITVSFEQDDTGGTVDAGPLLNPGSRRTIVVTPSGTHINGIHIDEEQHT